MRCYDCTIKIHPYLYGDLRTLGWRQISVPQANMLKYSDTYMGPTFDVKLAWLCPHCTFDRGIENGKTKGIEEQEDGREREITPGEYPNSSEESKKKESFFDGRGHGDRRSGEDRRSTALNYYPSGRREDDGQGGGDQPSSRAS